MPRRSRRRLLVITTAAALAVGAVAITTLNGQAAPAGRTPLTLQRASLPDIGSVKPKTQTFKLSAATAAGPDVREIQAAQPFTSVDVTWPGAAPEKIELRTRTEQSDWTPWRAIEASEASP